MSTWFLNNTGADQTEKLSKQIGDYIRLKWDSSKVGGLAIAAAAYVSDDKLTKVIADDYPFDKITNYYIEIRDSSVPISSENVRQNLYYMQNLVTFDVRVRGLASKSYPDQHNKIMLEIQRIFGQYARFDIPGYEIIQLGTIGPVMNPNESGFDGWRRKLDIYVWYFKQNTL